MIVHNLALVKNSGYLPNCVSERGDVHKIISYWALIVEYLTCKPNGSSKTLPCSPSCAALCYLVTIFNIRDWLVMHIREIWIAMLIECNITQNGDILSGGPKVMD